MEIGKRIRQWMRENVVDEKVDQQLSELELLSRGFTIWPYDASEEQKNQALEDLMAGKPYQLYPPKREPVDE